MIIQNIHMYCDVMIYVEVELLGETTDQYIQSITGFRSSLIMRENRGGDTFKVG